MSSVSSLISRRSRYRTLKSDINSIVSNLTSAIENLEIPAEKIKEFYTIDSISIDKGNINLIREELIDKRNFLKNIVINRIDREIQNINKQIAIINSMNESE